MKNIYVVIAVAPHLKKKKNDKLKLKDFCLEKTF